MVSIKLRSQLLLRNNSCLTCDKSRRINFDLALPLCLHDLHDLFFRLYRDIRPHELEILRLVPKTLTRDTYLTSLSLLQSEILLDIRKFRRSKHLYRYLVLAKLSGTQREWQPWEPEKRQCPVQTEKKVRNHHLKDASSARCNGGPSAGSRPLHGRVGRYGRPLWRGPISRHPCSANFISFPSAARRRARIQWLPPVRICPLCPDLMLD